MIQRTDSMKRYWILIVAGWLSLGLRGHANPAAAPTIVQQPQSATVAAGETALFEVIAGGTDTPNYQWFRNGSPLADATQPLLALFKTSTDLAGQYYVVLSNNAGSVTSVVATLTVIVPTPPTLITQPADVAGSEAGAAVFWVTAEGTEPLFYQWFKESKAIEDATNAVLMLGDLTTNDLGRYFVVASNDYGTRTSQVAQLTLVPPTLPQITKQPLSQSVLEGENVLLQVTATGTEPLSFQWLEDGVVVGGIADSWMMLVNISTNLGGDYTVIVTNLAGAVTSTVARIDVTPYVPRQFHTVGYSTNASGQILVPVWLTTLGDEVAIGGSLHFATNVLANPRVTFLTNAAPGILATDLSQVTEGRLGLKVTVPTGTNLPAGYYPFVDLAFDRVGNADPVTSALYWGSQPVALEATDTSTTNQLVTGFVVPGAFAAPGPMSWSAQSGLMTQKVTVRNLGRDSVSGVGLDVTGLTNDSQGVAIRVQNATKQVEGVPQLITGRIAGGAQEELTVEFYVADRVTQPTPVYTPLLVQSPYLSPDAGTRLTVDRALFTNGVFLVEFNTVATLPYYIQYREDWSDARAPWKTALPPVVGTGGRVQWMDSGPPKTDRVPASQTNRFYQVLRIP